MKKYSDDNVVPDKMCVKCGETKPAGAFHRNRTGMVIVCSLILSTVVFAGVPLGQVPDFKVRVRLKAEGEPPKEGYEVALSKTTSGPSSLVPPARFLTVADGQWSDWMEAGRDEVKAHLATYPNSYSSQWPVKFGVIVKPVEGTVHVDLEGQVEGRTERGTAELTGPNLGIAVWRDIENVAHISTLGTYNRLTYWSIIDGLELEGRLPQKILLGDRFISGDSDHAALKEGLAGLRKLGMNVIMADTVEGSRELAWEAGFRKTSGGVYNPPGYAFSFNTGWGVESALWGVPEGENISEVAVRDWAAKLRKTYTDVGFKVSDLAMHTIADEPGFYYPMMYHIVNGNPAYLARFHKYLRQQDLKPQDVGAEAWDTVKVIGRNNGGTLPEKRLFYWSQRFFPRQSAEHFAMATRAMEDAFYPGIPLPVNWNFFAGRCYVPGPFGNNPDKNDPNAAMGGHDWFEFARLRGTTTPWVEDWFGDEQAFQWSYYCEKLWSASPTGEFGGYVVPSQSGSIPDGMMYKLMSLIGHGGKQVKFWVFGPEYNFPGNCYSQNTRVFEGLARTTRMIGEAEELLYPGRPTQPQVALLHHLSSEMWDLTQVKFPDGIMGATNTNLNGRRAEYTAELYDLYLALMHRQVPVEFISEEDATWLPLEKFKVIYVVAPNVPVEAQRRLAQWVKAGGVLVTTSRAASADRYNEPTTILDEVRAAVEAPRQRLVIPDLEALENVGKVTGEFGEFDAFAVKGVLEAEGAQVIGTFGDGTPAVTRNRHGKGTAVHFALLPGICYRRSAKDAPGKFPEGFSQAVQDWINMPLDVAGVEKPVEVNVPFVEAPLLVSEKGLAITLLNWTNQPRKGVTIKFKVDRPVTSVSSVNQGRVPYRQHEGQLELKLPVDTVDVLLVRYK